MSIRRAVDHAIDLGSKHISLSPRQHKTFFRALKLGRTYRIYRNTIITVWGTRRMR